MHVYHEDKQCQSEGKAKGNRTLWERKLQSNIKFCSCSNQKLIIVSDYK